MKTPFIEIDGSVGEGGGQVLRTALALSLITQKPVQIEKIRGKRAKPGLMRQHLTAVRAAAAIGNAKVEGAEIKSQSLAFVPGKVKPGDYRFAVGTAGSTLLVLQTVLPVLMLADDVSTIEIEGGTHNSMAPSFDFIERVFLPVLKRIGCDVSLSLGQAGFYPAGGGSIVAEIRPNSQFEYIELLERGSLNSRLATAGTCNLSESVAERELSEVAKAFDLSRAEVRKKNYDGSPGVGNVLDIQYEYEHITELFTALGEKGLAAEKVAKDLIREAKRYEGADAPVGDYLADQLLLPMAIAGGGAFRTTSLSRHFTTNKAIIKKFLDVEIRTTREDRLAWLVEIESEGVRNK